LVIAAPVAIGTYYVALLFVKKAQTKTTTPIKKKPSG
jgi:hypothetical protein